MVIILEYVFLFSPCISLFWITLPYLSNFPDKALQSVFFHISQNNENIKIVIFWGQIIMHIYLPKYLDS